LTRKQPNISK